MPDDKFDEKEEEKEAEKREEKSPEEKSWDEKYRRDPLSAIVWAVIFIWAGVVLLLNNLNLLNNLTSRISNIAGMPVLSEMTGVWSLIMLGAGVIILVEVLVRVLVPTYRRPVTGSLILAIIFIAIGFGNLTKWDLIWPLILIVLGLSVLLRGLTRKNL